jgi:hypothetical protein
MTVKIGDYQFAIYERKAKRLRQPSDENQTETVSSLEVLCELMKGSTFPWYLVGGLGIDAHLGLFTRHHHDIDIEVRSEDVKDVAKHMHSKGYLLLKRLLTANISKGKRLALYQTEDGSSCIPKADMRVRFVKSQNGKVVDGELSFLSYIDVSFTKDHSDGVEIGYKGKTFTLPVPYTSKELSYRLNGHRLMLRNPMYQAVLKLSYHHPIDVFDSENLMSKFNEGEKAIIDQTVKRLLSN